jgi:hypothetical protein
LFAIQADEILPNCPAFAKVPAAIRDGIKLSAAQMNDCAPSSAAAAETIAARRPSSPSRARST